MCIVGYWRYCKHALKFDVTALHYPLVCVGFPFWHIEMSFCPEAGQHPDVPAFSFPWHPHHTSIFFKYEHSSLLLIKVSHAYLPKYWHGALHKREEKMLRGELLCGSDMQTVDRVGAWCISRQNPTGQENRMSTYFFRINRYPAYSHWTADVEKIREKLRLSPYCCCYLPSQCVRLPCIIDDSQQIVRECR